MKKNKTLKLLTLLTLLTPTIVSAKEYIICGNNKKFPTVIGTLISTFYIIIRIAVPILLVIMGIITFFKVTFAGNVEESLKKAKDKLITNIIAAIVIFFIASIINFVIGLAAGKNNNFTNCMYCMLHPNNCEQKDSDIANLCPGLLSDQDKYNPDCTLKDPDNPGERIDYGDTGKTGVPAYANTIAKAGGSAIARTLTDNPSALTNQNIVHKSYRDGYEYYLYIPKKIDGSKALIVYMHGTGGTGGGYATLKSDGGGGFLHEIEDKNVEYNCYILILHAPKIASQSGWNTTIVKEIIDQEVATNQIDKNRISIWGYSLGAEAIPVIVNNNPNFFASAVFIAKGANATVSGFKTVPSYGFYGQSDGYANRMTPAIIESIRKIGQEKAYIRMYPSPQNHAYMPNVVLEDTNIGNGFTTIIDWVLNQRRAD